MSDSCRMLRTAFIILLGLPLISPSALPAQDDSVGDTTSLQTFCGRHRAALAHPSSHEAYLGALRSIQVCGAMAGEVLGQQWRHPPEDSATVMLLGDGSASVRDRRLYEAVRDAAMSPGGATTARLAAIAALVAYADSTVRVTYWAIPRSEAVAAPPVSFPRVLHFPSREPWVAPLPLSAWSDVVALLSRLGESDPDDRVRR